MKTLHFLGLTHSDLKPDNVLLSNASDPQKVEAVYTDFGLSYDAYQKCMKQRPKPTGFTPTYEAPGQTNDQWPIPHPPSGDRHSYCLKMKMLVQKNDVFTHALVVYQTLTGKPLPWAHCPWNTASYHSCYLQAFQNFRNSLKNDASPLGRLLNESLEENPESRPSAANFAQRFKKISPTLTSTSPANSTDQPMEIDTPSSLMDVDPPGT